MRKLEKVSDIHKIQRIVNQLNMFSPTPAESYQTVRELLKQKTHEPGVQLRKSHYLNVFKTK